MKRMAMIVALLGCGQCLCVETVEPFSTTVSTSLVSEAPLSSMLASARAPGDQLTPFASIAYLHGDGASVLALTPGVAFSRNQIDLMLARIDLDDSDNVRLVRLRYKRALLTDSPINVTAFGSFQDVDDSSRAFQVGLAADRTLLKREAGSSSGELTLTANLSYYRIDLDFGPAISDLVPALALGWSTDRVGFSIEQLFRSDVTSRLTTFGVSLGRHFKASYDTSQTGQVALIFKW